MGDANSRIFEAVTNNDLPALEELLRKNSKHINAKIAHGVSLLETAIKRCSWKIAQRLIQAGANVRDANDAGLTPLHVLILRASSSQRENDIDGRLKTLSMLIATGADANAALPKESGLHLLVDACQWDIAETLIKAGADVNMKNTKGQTPLAFLLRKSLGTPVQLSQWSEARALIALLLKHGAKLPTDPSPLHAAVELNDERLLRLFVALPGVDVNSPGISEDTPLERALATHGLACIKTLLRAGAKPFSRYLEAAMAEHRQSSLELHEVFSAPGFNAKQTFVNGNTILHLVASSSYIRPPLVFPILDTLLKAGADLDARNGKNQRAADVAAYPEMQQWFEIAAAERKNLQRQTPEVVRMSYPKRGVNGYAEKQLIDALMQGDVATADAIYVQELTEHQAGMKRQVVNVNCQIGIPLLIHVAWDGNLPAVHWLVTHGADLSVRTKLPYHQLTVISAAVMSRNVQVLSYLLHLRVFSPVFLDSPVCVYYGNRPSSFGTALTCAGFLKDWRMTELLVEFGASTMSNYTPSHWRNRRLLFIGRMKDRDSLLAALPLDVIRLIDRCLRPRLAALPDLTNPSCVQRSLARCQTRDPTGWRLPLPPRLNSSKVYN